MSERYELTPRVSLEFRALCKALEALGCKKVTIEFSGSGDEGQINDVLYDPQGLGAEDEVGMWERVADFTDNLIYCHGYDYANNDGGGGNLSLDVIELKWDLNFWNYEDVYACSEEGEDEPELIDTLSHEVPATSGTFDKAELVRILRDGEQAERAEATKLLSSMERGGYTNARRGV